jgi:hypothetical protein
MLRCTDSIGAVSTAYRNVDHPGWNAHPIAVTIQRHEKSRANARLAAGIFHPGVFMKTAATAYQKSAVCY